MMNRLPRTIGAALFCLAALLILEKPALANVPIIQGVFGSSPAIFVSIWTMGVAFVAVVFIETAVFRYVFRMQWKGLLIAAFFLNLFSSVVGMIMGAFSFAHYDFVVVLLIAVIWIGMVVKRKGMPAWFSTVAYLTIVIGTIGAYRATFAVPSLPLGTVIFVLFSPLLLGFGLSILLEGYLADRYFGDEYYWRGIFLANVASYIFLALLMPFFAPNPYQTKEWTFESHRSQNVKPELPSDISGSYFAHQMAISMTQSGESADKVMRLFEDLRASNLYLLGLTRNNPAPKDYKAWEEIYVLGSAYASLGRNPPPETGMGIVQRLLQYPTLATDARNQLEWLNQHFAYWMNARKAIEAHDQQGLNAVYAEWSDWRNQTYEQSGWDRSNNGNGFEPMEPVRQELDRLNSDLQNPGADESETP